MILFNTRLKTLRETATEYISNKVDELGPIVLDKWTKVYKDGEEYSVGEPEEAEGGEPLWHIDITELCEIADRIHTLPAKNLP